MTAPPLRVVSGPGDVTAVQRLASRLWPAGWHPGGLGWALARERLGDEVVVLDGPEGVVGWAARGVHDPGERLAQVDPAWPDAAEAVVDWLADPRGASRLTIDVYDGDPLLATALEQSGFVPHREARGFGMFLAVDGTHASPPAGYSVRSVRDNEVDARVDVHCAAFATSSFTAVEYAAVRRVWLYEPSLDLVAVAPDGTLAGCCNAWLDRVSWKAGSTTSKCAA